MRYRFFTIGQFRTVMAIFAIAAVPVAAQNVGMGTTFQETEASATEIVTVFRDSVATTLRPAEAPGRPAGYHSARLTRETGCDPAPSTNGAVV